MRWVSREEGERKFVRVVKNEKEEGRVGLDRWGQGEEGERK